MEYLLILYWVIAGFAAWSLPVDGYDRYPLATFLICMALGGIMVPARLLGKAIR